MKPHFGSVAGPAPPPVGGRGGPARAARPGPRRPPAGLRAALAALALLGLLPGARPALAAGPERRDTVASLVERRETCEHFSGEEGYSWQRRAEIARALRKAGCDRLRDDENALLLGRAPAETVRRICAARSGSSFDHPTPAERAAGAPPCGAR